MMEFFVGLTVSLMLVVAIALWLILKLPIAETLKQKMDTLEEESTGNIPPPN